ncbi:MAG: tetratricopeptide repeat protein [Terriglobia bacterium]
MRKQACRILITLLLVLAFVPLPLRSQREIPHPEIMNETLATAGRQTWNVFGKVTDFKGSPLRAAAVRVDIGYGGKYIKDLTTNAQGEFRTAYTFDTSLTTRLSVSLLVNREGFAPAHEFVDYGVGDKTWEIDVAMRPDTVGDDELPVPALVAALAPKLRAGLDTDAAIAPAKKDLAKGASDFLDQRDAEKAVPSLTKVTKRYPACGPCRTLLGLALLDAGSWNGASRELAEAAKLAAAGSSNPDKIDSFLILAEIENWKGEYNQAAGFLMQATGLDPKNAFVLQELGRTLVLQKNWEAADEYLHRALTAGASKDAMLLRARALLEEGDPEAADGVMKDYLGDAALKTFPMPVRALANEVGERMKLQTYAKVESVVNEPLPSLIKAVPELRELQPASSQIGQTGQADLATILQKTGDNVRSFFTGFQNTVSTEQIHQERLAKDGKIKDSVDQRFQYLLLTRPEAWGLGLQEFRTDLKGKEMAPTGTSGLMLTSGFASESLFFHPAYQSGATFRYLGLGSVKGRECYVVAFAQKPEKAQMMERFNSNGESVLLLHQGLAWIDKENYTIARLRTDLLKPQSQIRLQRETTEITYDPVDFKQAGQVAWLPSEVAVTVQWWGRTFRNVHTYSDFKLFNTEVKETHQVPAAEPQ